MIKTSLIQKANSTKHDFLIGKVQIYFLETADILDLILPQSNYFEDIKMFQEVYVNQFY